MRLSHHCAGSERERGFSLIELLIVVAIILIIVAIAIPDLLKSRQAANQASAVASLRTINSSEVTFASTYNTGYSSTLVQLDGSALVATIASAGLIDSIVGGGQKSGYLYLYVACPGAPGPNDSVINMANGPCTGAGQTVATYQVSANPLAASESAPLTTSQALAVPRRCPRTFAAAAVTSVSRLCIVLHP